MNKAERNVLFVCVGGGLVGVWAGLSGMVLSGSPWEWMTFGGLWVATAPLLSAAWKLERERK